MTEQLIKPKSLGGLVRSLSGLFITKDNPLGLTSKECTVIAVILAVVKNKEITREHKIEISNQLNQSLQVTTNYCNKFVKKRVITQENKLHTLFFTKITIDGKHLVL